MDMAEVMAGAITADVGIITGGVEVMATMIYDQALNSLNWPFAAACSFALMLIVLGLTVLHGSLLRLRSQA